MYTYDNFQIFIKVDTVTILSVRILFYNPSPVYFHLPFIDWSKKSTGGRSFFSQLSVG